ncbi:MAG TPA: hypothetical protein VLV30_06975 [Methanomicrobiales archaeon]|nr:hypothetical protein [Methanomicrobiales archaeon]
MHLANRFSRSYPFIALVPALSVVFDYSMTIAFSGGRDAIMAFEYSPILRTAIANGLLVPCIAALALGYYLLAFVALRALAGTRYYPAGAFLVGLVGLTHVSGGLSWIVRDTAYSTAVIVLAVAGILLALGIFLLAIRRTPAAHAAAP